MEQNKVLAKKTETDNFKLLDKLLVHQKGWQHYACSVFIFNDNNELLLQQRALHKYHSPNLWSNTCCSHPLSANLKDIKHFSENRLMEEMGFTVPLDFIFKFEYNVKCDNNLIENEIDFVFVGKFNGVPNINKKEAVNYKWMNFSLLQKDIITNSSNYTEWLKIILKNYSTQF